MYEVIIPSEVERQLNKLDKSEKNRILQTLDRIKIRPEHFVEKLVGEVGFKLRVGDYRVILDINNRDLIILVIEIGHRKNIYKR